MGLRISLDNNLLANTPQGWEEGTIKSKRGSTFKGLFLTYSTDLEFWGDGFDYIDSRMDIDFCTSIDVTIETDDCEAGVWVTEFNGVIQIPQISSIDIDKRIIRTKIFDNTFDGQINSNKSIKAFLDVGASKNGFDINPVTPVQIDFFKTDDPFNEYDTKNRDGWRVFDAFEFIVQYITDGDVGFYSDLLSTEYYNYMLFNGEQIRTGAVQSNQIDVSFKELFTEVNKKINISFAIEPDGVGGYRVRLEETSYFEQDNALMILNDVPNILMSFNKDDLYSNVEIGSKPFDDDAVLSYPPFNFITFKEENYTLLGDCNLDKTLNLVSKWVIDTNIIEDVVLNNSEKYDKKIFLIVTDGTNCIKYQEYGDSVYTGRNTSTFGANLIDSGANFVVDGVVVGDMVLNEITGDRANVDSVAATSLGLDSNIFPLSLTRYQVRAAPFNYNNPLMNLNVIKRFETGLPSSVVSRLSTSSTANFEAGLNADLSDTVFPFANNPLIYNDDSTPPYFDDGGNYNITLGQYTVPNSGLYGFRATSNIRLNGRLGAHRNTNNWIVGESAGQSFDILTQIYINTFVQTSNAFLRARMPTPTMGNTITIIEFEIYDVEDPNEIIGLNINGFSPSLSPRGGGNYRVVIDYSESEVPDKADYFQWFFTVNGQSFKMRDIKIQYTPSFSFYKAISRLDATGTEIQAFEQTRLIVFNYDEFQRDITLINEETFSTFKDELITDRFSFDAITGSTQKATIKEGSTFETVLVNDGGGDVLPLDGEQYPIFKYKFEKAITFDQWKLLRDNPESAVFFSKYKDGHIFGWRNEISYKRETGIAEFELRSKTKMSTICRTE